MGPLHQLRPVNCRLWCVRLGGSKAGSESLKGRSLELRKNWKSRYQGSGRVAAGLLLGLEESKVQISLLHLCAFCVQGLLLGLVLRFEYCPN